MPAPVSLAHDSMILNGIYLPMWTGSYCFSICFPRSFFFFFFLLPFEWNNYKVLTIQLPQIDQQGVSLKYFMLFSFIVVFNTINYCLMGCSAGSWTIFFFTKSTLYKWFRFRGFRMLLIRISKNWALERMNRFDGWPERSWVRNRGDLCDLKFYMIIAKFVIN